VLSFGPVAAPLMLSVVHLKQRHHRRPCNYAPCKRALCLLCRPSELVIVSGTNRHASRVKWRSTHRAAAGLQAEFAAMSALRRNASREVPADIDFDGTSL